MKTNMNFDEESRRVIEDRNKIKNIWMKNMFFKEQKNNFDENRIWEFDDKNKGVYSVCKSNSV